MFSIIIPTFNNIEYLKICLNSLKKNSKYKHEIIIHINEGSDGTLDFVKQNNLKHTYTQNNVGLCTAVNLAAKHATTNFIILFINFPLCLVYLNNSPKLLSFILLIDSPYQII